jgi:hypothetical protein
LPACFGHYIIHRCCQIIDIPLTEPIDPGKTTSAPFPIEDRRIARHHA